MKNKNEDPNIKKKDSKCNNTYPIYKTVEEVLKRSENQESREPFDYGDPVGNEYW